LPEIVEDGTAGFLVEAGEPAAIAMAVRALAGSPSGWSEKSLAARGVVEARFTWGVVADRCLAAYGAGDCEAGAAAGQGDRG
jgi:glycosyltransferase involved in cell wall biosynthesis